MIVMINIILRGIFAMFFSTIAYYVSMPMLFAVAYEWAFWVSATPQQIVIRDNLYGVFLILPALWIGVIIFWMYSAVSRRTTDAYA